MKIYSQNAGSEGAKHLAEALDVRRIRHEGSRYVPRPGHKILNWGSSNLPEYLKVATIINKPEAVAVAVNKLSFFNKLNGNQFLPPFVTTLDEASAMIDGGHMVVCRTVLNGHSGQGIVLAEFKEQLVNAPLYVQYIPKKEEYRVHIVDGQVIDIQQKARRHDVPDPNWRIRNHANGFIYKREGVSPHPSVMEVGMETVKQLGLDFGAVDIIWNNKQERAYVLEVNTAPGLEGTTVEKYAEALRKYL